MIHVHHTAITDDNARADIAVSSFWSSRQRSFLDVRVFNPFSHTYNNSSIKACHGRNEKDKRCQYGERICNVEHASFTPLVWVHQLLLFINTFHPDSPSVTPSPILLYSTGFVAVSHSLFLGALLCVSVVPDHHITILSTLSALMNKLSQTGESINLHVASCIL